VPALNLRKHLYDELVRTGFDPATFMNGATEIVLKICKALDLKPESAEDTESVLRRVEEKVDEWLKL